MARKNNPTNGGRRPQASKSTRHQVHQPMDSVNQQHVRALYLASIR